MAPRPSSPKGALSAHRGLLLDAIREAGQVSRAGLARSTGLNAATVTLAIRDLLADGLIFETGLAPSTGGKPAVLLALARESRFAVGVHLDHTSITYVAANLSGGVIDRQFSRGGADAGDPQLVVERMAAEIAAFVRRTGIDRERLVGIGLVSPGPATSAHGIALSSPEMRPWVDFPLVSALATAAGRPVVLGNDATASGIGEYWTGHAKATDAFAAVYMGTGIGAGIVIAGRPMIGSSGNAGEVGHTCVVINGDPCWCGSDGCLETVAGAAAIVAQARAAGLNPSGEFLDEQFADLARAALRDNRIAVRIFEDAAQYVAVAVQSLANILDLDRVILTGPSFGIAGELYLPTVRRRLELSFFARKTHAIEVTISTNATVAAATGAAAMVLQRELAPVPAVSGRAAVVVVGSQTKERVGWAAPPAPLAGEKEHVAG